MFRKLSSASILMLALGAQAQKKVATVPFCATPTLEAAVCAVGTVAPELGVLRCGGNLLAVDDITTATIVDSTGDHLSPLRSGTCGAAGDTRVGVWESSCVADVYEPIVTRLDDAAAVITDEEDLQALCEDANPPTPAQAETDGALCSSQLSVTQNTPARGMSKFGSTTWYNYLPVPTYRLVGGYTNAAFPAPAGSQVYCVFWPSHTAIVGKVGGGTNKWAKPVIKDITTSSLFTNAPDGADGFFDLPVDADEAAEINAALFAPLYQETITVNYFKSYLPATQL